MTGLRSLMSSLVFLAAISVAAAQALPPRSIKLTAEQSHIIKEIVFHDMKVQAAPDAGEVKIGGSAPAVELHNFPDEISRRVAVLKTHKFFVAGSRIVIVDPRDNLVADIIE